MLQKLYISNYAIIDEIAIKFSSKLNIITGETGAGKSILMGALGLILGDRADSSVLLNKDKKSVVEATFRQTEPVRCFLVENELDVLDELLVRREIGLTGKSRAFINDTPVNVSQLKALGVMLIDLHQQFDTQELGNDAFQRSIIDALAGNQEKLQQYGAAYTQYKQLQKEIEELKDQQQQANAALDYNRFLFDELEELNLKENELELLDEELKLLSHAEEVKLELSNIYFGLKESEEPVLQQIKILASKLSQLGQYHTVAKELGDRMHSVQVELDDIADSTDQLNRQVQYDPERMQLVNDRVEAGYRLLKKHAVQTTAELLAVKKALQQKLESIFNISGDIAAREKEAAVLLDRCRVLAGQLSDNRKKAGVPFSEKVNTLLKQVGMPNAIVKVSILPVAMNAYGTDEILFLFDANKTGHFEPVGKVASGGELSRLMLCVKSIVARKLQLPTLIFDEIDTGISGEAAKQVGLIMKELATNHQVISITHQPQIAAKADAHYFVYKAVEENRITTGVRLLSNKERITAIARMLDGETPSQAAMDNAKEMVG